MTQLREAKAELIKKLQALELPTLSPSLTTNEVLAARDHLDSFVALVDDYLLAIGSAVKRNTNAHVDLMEFTHVLREATQGFASYELDCVVDEIRTLAEDAA